MDLHRSYLATTCRICTEVIASSRTYTIGSVSTILQDVYKDKHGCDVSKDNADTESKNVCNRCYTCLVRWNADHQKFLLHKRKNPNSTKEFKSSSKLPPSIEHPFVHLENGCVCSAGKIDDTADKSDTDEDEHDEASRAGDIVDEDGCTPSYSKAVEDNDSGEVLLGDPEVKNIFTSQDSFEADKLRILL